jgi:hypothetical protein
MRRKTKRSANGENSLTAWLMISRSRSEKPSGWRVANDMFAVRERSTNGSGIIA